MLKRFRIIPVLLLCLMLALPAAHAESRHYAVGDTIDDFTLTTTDGETVSLSGLLGQYKAVMLNFFFTTCNPCAMEFPYMEQAYQDVQDDLAILAISSFDTEEDIAAYKAEKGLSIRMARDTAGLTDRFVSEGFPTTVIIDRYGVYCYYECGAVLSREAFDRLFAPFLAEEYSESLTDYDPSRPTAVMPDAADMAAQLDASGGTLAFSADEDASAWPWLLAEDEDGRAYAYSSNAGVNASSAVLHVSVTAQAGDALAFDYALSCETSYDYLVVRVDGQVAKVFSGETPWSAYALPLDEGIRDVSFAYEKDTSDAAGEDRACISRLRLLSGQEAAEALAANPAHLVGAEAGTVSLQPASDGLREIAVELEADTLARLMGPNARFFVAQEGAALDFRIALGPDIDPDAGLLFYNYDSTRLYLPTLQAEGDAYLLTLWGIDTTDTTQYASSTLYYYPRYQDTSLLYSATIFADESNADHFWQVDVPAALGSEEPIAWHYTGEDTAAPTGQEAAYTLIFTDQHGDAVPGVIANVCNDDACMPVIADDQGVASFTAPACAYDVHILQVPTGYAFDMSQSFTAPVNGGEMRFTLTKE